MSYAHGSQHNCLWSSACVADSCCFDPGSSEFSRRFSVSPETTIVAFNPTIVMRPELAKSAEELTAENYKKDIEDVTKLLDQAVKDKTVTPEQKESILKKMNENLAKLN